MHRSIRIVIGVAAALLVSREAVAQLRPLDPFEWRLYDGGPAVVVEAGAAAYADQRAALAGAEGTLYEVGTFRAFWRTGRVVFEAAGTAQRLFHETRSYAEPDMYVEPAPEGRRRDSGDYLVISTVRLTPERAAGVAMLRFGTRLPTTNNRTGLERDMTDFFALAGGSVRNRRLRLGAEAGVSINGTRDPEYEQKDVLVYVVRAEGLAWPIIPSLTLTGDVLGPRFRVLRGNEPLGEARLGLRTTGRRWLRAEGVVGYRTYSPSAGVRVMAGMAW
jgi:hypothetical protein